MDSSPVLRLQSQSKIHSDIRRMQNEPNRMSAHPKPSKPQSSLQLPGQNIENQDPGNSPLARKVPVRTGGSRLPVLAKSLHLQTPSDFSQSHCRWEEKLLSGKAKSKRPSTRPIQFNLSQPRSSRVASENHQPLTWSQTKNGISALQPYNIANKGHLRTKNMNSQTTKHTIFKNNVDLSKCTGKSNDKDTKNNPLLPGLSVPSAKLKTAISSKPRSSASKTALHQNNSTTFSAQPAPTTEACLANMNLLSLKDSTKSFNASKSMPLDSQGNVSKGSTGEQFQPNHAALLSILRNEGVSATGFGSPQFQPYNFLPQRVSVLQGRQKPVPPTASVKSVNFSPDSAALQSILQNKGIKSGGPVGATNPNPVRQSGRGTSVFEAKRVPVKKNYSEAAGGSAAVPIKETPQKKWTPQRILGTGYQPISAMKWHMSAKKTPYGSPSELRSCKSNLQPQQEEVVQRLFNDLEDRQSTTNQERQTEQPEIEVKTLKCKDETSFRKESENENEEKENRIAVGQPIIQRESVIFWSTGKTLLKASRFEKQEISTDHEQHGPVSSAQGHMLPVHEETLSVSEPSCRINPVFNNLHKDTSFQKTSSKSPAVAMLRKRLPQMEELRMDEEVATYTSMAIQAVSGFLPPVPRCRNPLASILHFEEYSRFVSISCDLSCPSSPQSSPQQES